MLARCPAFHGTTPCDALRGGMPMCASTARHGACLSATAVPCWCHGTRKTCWTPVPFKHVLNKSLTTAML